MLLRKAHQLPDLDLLPIIGNDRAVVTPEHLVHLAVNDTQIGGGRAIFERREGQVEAACFIAEMPGAHVVPGNIIEPDLLQLVDAPVQDDGILAGPGEIPESKPQIQPDGAAIRQETGSRSPVPEGLIFPHPAAPIQRPQAGGGVQPLGDLPVGDRPAGRQLILRL